MRSIWLENPASIREAYFLLLRIHGVKPLDSLVCGELAQSRELHNVYRAACNPEVRCVLPCSRGNGVFARGTKLSPLSPSALLYVPPALAVLM